MKIQGEFRVRLVDAAAAAACAPSWRRVTSPAERAQQREADLARVTELDTGWTKNVVTDLGRRKLAALSGWGASVRLFIHEGTNASNVRLTSLSFCYPAAQTPTQVQTPDTTTLDATLLLQTRTKLFAVPLTPAARTINIVGLCDTTVLVSRFVQEVIAFTKLSTPVVQGPTQAADVTYRVTWSLD